MSEEGSRLTDDIRGRPVPTQACRHEDTSYHYAPAADFCTIRNSAVVAKCMEINDIPCVSGKT